ncbi:MAG: aminoglycoside phosphotransferase family protein, partial [Nanoarchaeota archaeon]|nr:aminoglycoside phosphotransferase family protein [Nanoarchaeota archaeon]
LTGLTKGLLQKGALRFESLPGTRNEVVALPFDNYFGNKLVFKRSNSGILRREYDISRFGFDIYDQKDAVSPPLTFIDFFQDTNEPKIEILNKYQRQFYFVMWRLAGQDLREVVGEKGISTSLTKKAIEALAEFHLRATHNKEKAKDYFKLEEYKFRERYDHHFASMFDFDERQEINALFLHFAQELQNNSNCVSHGDFHTGNVIQLNNGRLSIIDLEKVCLAPPSFDITNFLEDEHVSSEKNKEKIITEYHSIVSSEKEIVPDYEKFLKMIYINSLFTNSRFTGIKHSNIGEEFGDSDSNSQSFNEYRKRSLSAINSIIPFANKKEKEILYKLQEKYESIKVTN